MNTVFVEAESLCFDSIKGKTKYEISELGGTAGIIGATSL
jgi:hypothetical protein